MNDLPSTRNQRRRLLARIRQNYQTITDRVPIGNHLYSFTRIADPNLVLDQVAAREDLRERLSPPTPSHRPDPVGLPYWAELWDSSLAVAHHLTHLLDPQKNLRVLDLGCGMGFTAMVPAALGSHLLVADLEPPALLFAQLNCLQYSSSVRARRLNWRTDRLAEQFDLIVGCDILYEKTQWEFQEPFFQHHLAANGTVLLAEPGRQTGDLFLEWLRPKPWTLHRLEQTVPTRTRPIRLFRLSRRQATSPIPQTSPPAF